MGALWSFELRSKLEAFMTYSTWWRNVTLSVSWPRHGRYITRFLAATSITITIMALSLSLELPLPLHEPPSGYRALSASESTTSAFRAGLDQRDRFLGKRRCIVCGIYGDRIMKHCHIIMESESDFVSQNGIQVWGLLRLMWDAVAWPQGPPVDPWAGPRTPSRNAQWGDDVQSSSWRF